MVSKKKDPSWDEIGSAIGKKVEKEFKKEECGCTKKPWVFHYHEYGGGFGRLVFIVALLIALGYSGMLQGIPIWILVLLGFGFTFMKL